MCVWLCDCMMCMWAGSFDGPSTVRDDENNNDDEDNDDDDNNNDDEDDDGDNDDNKSSSNGQSVKQSQGEHCYWFSVTCICLYVDITVCFLLFLWCFADVSPRSDGASTPATPGGLWKYYKLL